MAKNFQLGLKRALDVTVSLIWLGLLAIPFLIIALAIKWDSRGPVFFRQTRVGQGGRLFTLYKFRTLQEGSRRGEFDRLRKDDPRITRVGGFLRTWGIDELPQLWNVLRGEMSLVGPRPTLKYQVDRYDEYQKKRLQVKPGITGWAFIHGRNILSWSERIDYDIWYIENWSLWLDFQILLSTIGVILRREGVYGPRGVNDTFGSSDPEEEHQ